MEARSLCLCVCHFSKWLIMAVMLSDWLSGSVCELKLMARFFSPKIPDTCQALPAIETKDRILNQFIWAGEFQQFRGQACSFERLGHNLRWKRLNHNSGSHVHYILRRESATTCRGFKTSRWEMKVSSESASSVKSLHLVNLDNLSTVITNSVHLAHIHLLHLQIIRSSRSELKCK